MGSTGEHCTFVLLAEFDIDRGAQLTYQFPQPLGTDEGLLANLMLPDGAERQAADWTIFFLNQTPFNRIAPVLALDTPDVNGGNTSEKGDGSELLYVLNLVQTKHDKLARRGAVVKAMAICTRHPFIQIFKPVLLLALEDYFATPSQECLARLFDAVNAMDISAAPTLTRDEKLIMRVSDRKDVFTEKFISGVHVKRPSVDANSNRHTLIAHSNGSHTSFEGKGRTRADSIRSHTSASEASFGGNANGNGVWTAEDGTAENVDHHLHAAHTNGRHSIDQSSESSHGLGGRKDSSGPASVAHGDARIVSPKDTHFFSTTIVYKGHTLPIKMPLSTFPEEVGDYSLIQLVQTFSSPNTVVTGPQHPHLHTNGSLTHPVILLFNALITGKRIIFLGYQRPAGLVSNYVLAACALGSGSGAVLRGFIERAFPYANLTNRDEWENISGFIAGVTNPIFETASSWDFLCDIGTNRVVVHKDIFTTYPLSSFPPPPGTLLPRSGTLKAEVSVGSEDEMGVLGRISVQRDVGKGDMAGKADSADNVFMDDIISAISFHFGESLVRARFTEYVLRFVRIAARYEEESYGSTKIGYKSASFMDSPGGLGGQLGSGMIFPDDAVAMKEIALNANRIEGWRRTTTYEYYVEDFQWMVATKPIQGFDLYHQLFRLKNAKNMSDAEAELITRTLVENVQTYDQVVELLACLPPHLGGLLPVTFGLFHQQEFIRDLTVELLTVLRSFPIGVQFLQGLNHFHRYAYVRQAHAREARTIPTRDQNSLYPPSSTLVSRTPSNRSESSLGAG